jgi:sporulation protein YlmC with PRC-barrel domain
MKRVGIWVIGVVIGSIFVTTQAYSADQPGQVKAVPGVGKEPESGLGPEEGHLMGVQSQSGMNGYRATEIIGKPVVAGNGEKVGELEDVVIFQNGQVHYGILSLKARGSETYTPVPFEAMEINESDQLTVNLEKEKIENAPGLSRQELSTWWNSDVGEKIYSYYGQEPLHMMPMQTPGVGKGQESGIPQN